MGNWYRVTKCINGRLYDYWQRTYRVARKVKTENRYIGPSAKQRAASIASTAEHQPYAQSPSEKVSIVASPRQISLTAPAIPEEAIHQLTPFTTHLTARDRRDYERERERARREDERIQYGNLKARIENQKAALRKAKRETRGIKSLNPFIAKVLKKS